MERKLGNFEVINSLIMMSIADIVLTSAGILIKEVNSASLLTSCLISILGIFITFIMCKLSKNFIGKNILNISEYLGGKILKTIVGFGFVIYFILILALFLRQTSDAMQLIYYPLTHIIFIIALLSIATGIIASFGNNSIFKATSLIVPFLYTAISLSIDKGFHSPMNYQIRWNCNKSYFRRSKIIFRKFRLLGRIING